MFWHVTIAPMLLVGYLVGRRQPHMPGESTLLEHGASH
jgi:hypothetical protein